MAGRVRCLYRGAGVGCMRGQLHQGESEQLRWMIACCVRRSSLARRCSFWGGPVGGCCPQVEAAVAGNILMKPRSWFRCQALGILDFIFSGFAKLTHKLALRWVESRSRCGLNKFLLMPLFWIVLHLFDCSGGWIPEIDSRCRWKYISCFRAPSIGAAQLSFVKKKSLDSNICSTWYFSRLQGPKG